MVPIDEPVLDQRTQSIFVRDRLAVKIAFVLIAASAISWVASYNLLPLMSASSEMMGTGVASIVPSFSATSVGVFELIWVLAMAAMMFPAMLPIILIYNRIVVSTEMKSAVRIAGTPLFLLGYLAMYAGLGLAAFVAVFSAVVLASSIPSVAALAIIAPGLVMIASGLYQLSPLKLRCLSNCVSPMGFFALHSRRGLSGAIKMGFSHGRYCVGCCWAYMLVMLAVAAMSVPFMALLAGIITIEKVIVRGAVWFNRSASAGFLILGISSFFFPEIVTLLSHSI